MNTKDNQEAELLRLDELLKIKEACEKALAPIGNMSDAPVLNALKKGMEFHNAMWPQQILNLVNEVLELRATLTTPKVNEEVAFSDEDLAMFQDNAERYNLTTPSPSNVLVEALQRDNSELKDFIAKAFLAHPNLDLDIEAVATYSASTDKQKE